MESIIEVIFASLNFLPEDFPVHPDYMFYSQTEQKFGTQNRTIINTLNTSSMKNKL